MGVTVVVGPEVEAVLIKVCDVVGRVRFGRMARCVVVAHREF
jgi:hypothetical protein